MFKLKNIFFFMTMITTTMFMIPVYVAMGKIFFIIIFHLYRCPDICVLKYFVGAFAGLLLKIFNSGDPQVIML